MMKECLQFLIEPATKIKTRLKESRKKVPNEKKESLVESQLFIMELARELNKLCQRSKVLAHIWTSEDNWPPGVCRQFIVEWAAVLEKRAQPRSMQTELQAEWPEKRDWNGHLLCMMETVGEYDIGSHKRPSIWPGEAVLMTLDDLEFQWRRGRLPNLLPAMELVMWVVLNAACYIPHNVWNWICDAAEEVTLDPKTANPDLLISDDGQAHALWPGAARHP
ncbi:unnamed protein product [Coregonus sp. 'balchen']|nr:unnamed protein product [Coregonus sp. 'balchen']